MAAAVETVTPPSSPLSKKGRAYSPRKLSVGCTLTPTRTDQGDTDTCRFHTISRIIIHIIFDPLLGDMNEAELDKYASFMPLKTPMPEGAYSVAKCSEKGYLKIMLFYYFFYLAQKLDSPSIKGESIQELLEMPEIGEVDVHLFDHLKSRINTNVFGYQIQLDNPDLLPDIFEKAIKPVLRFGLYLELGLEEVIIESDSDSESESKIPPGQHIVLIVGAEEAEEGAAKTNLVVIKNSWGGAESKVPFDEVIELEDEQFSLVDIFFVLPNDLGSYSFDRRNMDTLYGLLANPPPPKGGKKRKTKYGQRRNHHKPKTIRASRKRSKTRYSRRLSKH